MRQQSLNLRKDESLSSIPWLNQRLKKLEIAPYLRRMLSQADLNWSPGRLLVLGIALFALPFYAAYQYWGLMLVALGIGALLGAAPFAFVVFKRKRRFAQFEKSLAGVAGSDGERTARRPQPGGGDGPGRARVSGSGGKRIQDLL